MKKRKHSKPGALRRVTEESDMPVMLPELSDGIEKNEYYLKVSRRFKFARLVAAVSFVLFLLSMIALRPDDITTANIMYLFRDLNISSDGGEAFSGVSYSAEPIQRFDVYRGELLYVTGREVRLFSATGGLGLSTQISFEQPEVDVSEKYALIYDIGGRVFTVCNSFSELYRETLEFEIISADMAESGDFVIAASGRDKRATVYLYGDDFSLRAKYQRTDYVSGAALSDDGATLVMTSFGVDEGEYYTDVGFYEVGADTQRSSHHIAGEYPLSVRTMKDGFAVITTASVYFFDGDGNVRGSYTHGGGIGTVSSSDSFVLLSTPKNTLGSENSIVILDSDAKVCYNAVIGEKLVDAAVSSHGEAFLLAQSHAVMIDIEAGTEKTAGIGAGARRIIPTGRGTALLCMSSSAKTIDFLHPQEN